SVCTGFSPQVVSANLSNCANGTVTFTVQNPGSGVYTWYSSLTPQVQVATGTSFTTPPITATSDYWVIANVAGCISAPTKVTAVLLPQLAAPTVTSTATSTSITFNWTAVPGATGYNVYNPSTSTTAIPVGTATTYQVSPLTP